MKNNREKCGETIRNSVEVQTRDELKSLGKRGKVFARRTAERGKRLGAVGGTMTKFPN